MHNIHFWSPIDLCLFHSTALESYLGRNMTDSICDFSIQHYACLPQVDLLNGCTLCTDIINVEMFDDFMHFSAISASQTQSRAAIIAHTVQTVWQHDLPQRNVEAVLHQILCKPWRCSSNAFKHGKDSGS